MIIFFTLKKKHSIIGKENIFNKYLEENNQKKI
jgi:hypothetical protein